MTTATTNTSADRIDERTIVIRVRGDVTAASEGPLMAAYGQAGDKTRVIVLDFSGLDYMNSGGIGLLVTLLVRANRQKQKLLACGWMRRSGSMTPRLRRSPRARRNGGRRCHAMTAIGRSR
jgi:anti-anti-sigma factor